MGIIELIIAFLIIFWLGGFAFHIAGGLIHLLLIVAIVLLIVRFVKNQA